MDFRLPPGDYFRVTKVAQIFDKHKNTIERWSFRGVRGHRLRTIRIGAQRYVTRSDLEEFLAALNAPSGDTAVAAHHDQDVDPNVSAGLDDAGI